MTTDRPRFWKSIPFIVSTLLIMVSYLAFWILPKPETVDRELRAAGSPAGSQQKMAEPVKNLKQNKAVTGKHEKIEAEVSAILPPPSAAGVAFKPLVKEHLLKKGDTLYLVLSKLGVSDREIFDITTASKKIYHLRKIHPGQTLAVTFKENEQGIASLSYEIDPFTQLEVVQSDAGFSAEKKNIPFEKEVQRRAGTITGTLYESARRLGVPAEVILRLSDIFAWDIDFGNDIRKGDHFNVVYEVHTRGGEAIRTGRILAAEMSSRGEMIRAYYFEAEGERGGYFDANGHSLRKAFLKSPLRYRYISSGYATKRLHPVLKINRPHLGIDFAARRGTPVRAAADGVVTFAGWNGGHGKTVIIRHRNGYKTLYGHLASFFRGIKKGKKVKQEDFIGRVGSTGLSTGPHLHYTLYKNGRAINPRKADVLRGKPLPEEWRSLFSRQVTLMNQYLYPTPDLLSDTDSL